MHLALKVGYPPELLNSCMYKLYESAITPECRACHVHQGAAKIRNKARRMPVEGEELLGVC